SVQKFGNSYFYLHRIYAGITGVFLFIFIRMIDKRLNVFLIVCSFLSINYIFVTTQNRYFAGYFLVCISLYLFHFKYYKFAITLFVISLLFHNGTIIFAPFFLLSKFNLLKNSRVLLAVVG